MDKHEEKYCPKCSAAFTCKMGDIANCQCNTVQLNQEAINFLSNTYFECLCSECLVKINHDMQVAKAYQFPTQKEMLIEDLHYYKEGNNCVFTALYHTLRGYCCNNGCRHCVYGFKK
ncbi:cysteine-rich CWC family protein [Parasediminibacterium sp. JCM 36343]|uniref:cysteine-rich CWC family protein n=1 Tax=Parasediminibacterium sp. JCM 36343 TaxID=3374279 RepID=UPI00397BE24A